MSDITDEKIKDLKEKYSTELRNSEDNPIRVCLKLIFEAATVKDRDKRIQIASDLSKFLCQPDGINNLCLAIIDFDTSSQMVTTHNQRFFAVANIITCLPALSVRYEDFCTNILKQLKPLLLSDNPKYSTLASIIVKALIDSPHAKKVTDINGIVLAPILNSILHGDETFAKCHETILLIHTLLQNLLPVELFVIVFPNLLYCLITLNNSPSRLKLPLRKSLVGILNGLKPGVACCLIESSIFYRRDLSQYYILHTDQEDISVRVSTSENRKQDAGDETIKQILLALLEDCDNELLILEFFFHINEIMWTSEDDWSRSMSATIVEKLLVDATEEQPQADLKLDLLSIIATNVTKSFQLIVRTLSNHLSYLKAAPEEFPSRLKLVDHSLSSCLDILQVLAVTSIEDDHKLLLNHDCLPILKNMIEVFNRNCDKSSKIYINLTSMIEQLESSFLRSQSVIENSSSKSAQRAEREYESILKDLNDQLVPVRVHALVRLKQMIISNEPFIVQKIPQIYPMIECSLGDSEPYVFLACIKLLAEMSVRKTAEILPKLAELYARKDLDIQHRINVGEVLVQTTKQMNETTPFYAQQVINIFFNGCKDAEELIRMSGLTNIGLICGSLGDALGKYMVDILACIEPIIRTDTVQVKCAAVDLLRTTLAGLDSLKVESIQRELRNIYHLLKNLKLRSLDDSLSLQVDLALDEIDRLGRELLGSGSTTSERGLVKNLKVVSLL